MNKKIFERFYTLEQSEKFIDEYYKKNNIELSIKKYGNILSSTVASFKNKNDLDCVGCGKGYEQEARVGSKYEFYEHNFGLKFLRKNCFITNFNEVISQKCFLNFLPIKLLKESNPSKIAVIKLYNSELKESLLFPQFLLDYRYNNKNKLTGDDADYSKAKRYSCGTGIAAGCNFEESSIHAISEVIERHSVGIFLSNTFFFKKKNINVRHINKYSIKSDYLNLLIADAEKELNSKIEIFDISQKNMPSVFIAFAKELTINNKINVFGAGCSLHTDYAAIRSIKELVQQYSIYKKIPWVKKEWEKHYQHIVTNAIKLKDSFIADIFSKDIKTVDMYSSNYNKNLSLHVHLKELILLCNQNNLKVYTKEIDNSNKNINMSIAVIPNMERFSIVSLGNIVVPTFHDL